MIDPKYLTKPLVLECHARSNGNSGLLLDLKASLRVSGQQQMRNIIIHVPRLSEFNCNDLLADYSIRIHPIHNYLLEWPTF